jgi:16S rRNA (cytidine1402-2'-O)-methyltransferase
MPSILPTNNTSETKPRGVLYIVATPIGNLQDITLRALEVLESVDIIAAEDTRKTGQLLKGRDIKGRFISYHEHNEEQRGPLLLGKLQSGQSVAVVSDAGTPLVSDPGFRLVQSAVDSGIDTIPIPGASAAIAALSVSGLPSDGFVFAGFPARKKGRRLKQLRALQNVPYTLIFYESPKRIATFLAELHTLLGDRSGVLAREITKRHEEFLRGHLSELLLLLKERPTVKGECTLLVAGNSGESAVTPEFLKDDLTTRMKQKKITLSEIVREVSAKTGLSKKMVYAEALKIKKENRG